MRNSWLIRLGVTEILLEGNKSSVRSGKYWLLGITSPHKRNSAAKYSGERKRQNVTKKSIREEEESASAESRGRSSRGEGEACAFNP